MAVDEQTKLILQISADMKSLERTLQRAGVLEKQFNREIQKDFTQSSNVIAQQSQRVDKSMRQTQQAAQNLSFQFNDIAQGLLAGTSPFTIMIQQSGQAAQAIEGLGKGNVLKGIGGALMSFLSPANLAISALIIGFGYLSQAAFKYFTTVEAGEDAATKAFRDHLDALDKVIDSYGDFDPVSKKILQAWVEEEKLNQATQELARTINALKTDSLQKLNKQFEGIRGVTNDAKRAIDSAFGRDQRGGLLEELALDYENLLKTIEDGKDASGIAKGLIATLRELERLAPGAEFGEWADQLEKEIVPNLEKTATRQKALNDLQKQMQATTRAAQEQQKRYNDALEEMGNVGKAALTDVEKILQQHAIALNNAKNEADRYVASLEKTKALSQLSFQAGQALGASLTSGLDEFTQKVMHIESRGNNSAQSNTSSASGLFGFIDSTFVRMVRALDGFSQATDQQILAQKGNVELQKRAFQELTRQNAEALAAAGKPINDTTRYLAHFLGSGGALKALNADPGANAEKVLGSAAAAANPTVIGNGKTIQDVINFASEKVGAAQASLGAKAVQEENAELRDQLTIRNEISAGIDKKVEKEEAALKLAELTRAAEKKAAEEGRTLSQLETAELKKQADEYGRLKGLEAAAKQNETFEGRLRNLREENELLTQQVAQLNASTVAIDTNKVAQEAANEALKIEQSLRASGTVVTSQQSAAILAQTTAIATAKAQIDSYEKSQKKLTDSQRRFNEQAVQTAQTAFSGFINDLRNGVSAADAFRNALNRVIDGIINMAIESMFAENALGGVIGKFFSGFGFGGMKVGTAHRGTGGGVTDMRSVNPGIFAGAPRLHNGLQPGEFPAILQQGERVVPRSVVRRGGSGGGGNTYLGDVKVDVTTGAVTATNQDARDLGRRIDTAVQAVLVRESRPGGLLKRA